MVNVDLIAIIPARGGSRRIPRKNISDFAGKPMLAWTIDAATQSGLFERILVSTDDAEIAEVAKRFGAAAPFMRHRAADDEATATEATLAALEQAEAYWSERYKTVVQLMPNCPLRGAADIVKAVTQFHGSGEKSLISCFPYGWMNPWWAHRLDAQGHPQPLFPDAITRRSQDLEKLFCPSGAVWIADVDALRKTRSFYGEGCVFYPMSWSTAMDIDDPEDLMMAKAARVMLSGAA
jgi:CMP-N-acetylneuraminic acid synthetase